MNFKNKIRSTNKTMTIKPQTVVVCKRIVMFLCSEMCRNEFLRMVKFVIFLRILKRQATNCHSVTVATAAKPERPIEMLLGADSCWPNEHACRQY